MPHLPPQIESILRQDHPHWHLLVSDDGSTDGSRDYAQDLQASHPDRITAMDGPRRGYGANFQGMLLKTPGSARFVCLVDQDDFWSRRRLSRAVSILQKAGDQPAIAMARREISDKDLGRLSVENLADLRISFRNALFESVLPGNAMMMNRTAFLLIRKAMEASRNVTSHDWLIYQIAMGAGIRILFDDEPTVLYRQHDRNQVGSIAGLARTISRLRAFSFRRYRALLGKSWDDLLRNRDLLNDENRRLLDDVVALGGMTMANRWKTYRRNAYFRNRRADQIALDLTVLTGLPVSTASPDSRPATTIT